MKRDQNTQDALNQHIKAVLHQTVHHLLPAADPNSLIAPHVWRDSNYVGMANGKVVVWRGWRVKFDGTHSPYRSLYVDVVENSLPVTERERLFGQDFAQAVAGLPRFVVMYALNFPPDAYSAIKAEGFVPRQMTRVLHACLVTGIDPFLDVPPAQWAEKTARLVRLQSEWQR